jgi:hypothetical protein
VAERFADREASYPDLSAALRAADQELQGARGFAQSIAFAACMAACPDRINAAMAAAKAAQAGDRAIECAGQARLLRCILGNPFRPVSISPAWRTPTVVAIARAAYEERGFEELPVLADALEEAGCDNRDVLDHCRHGGEHARGCWVVDGLLDKQ